MQKEKHVSDFNQDETKPVATSSLGRFSLDLEKSALGTRLNLWHNLQSKQVKGTPPTFCQWIDYLKNEPVSRSRNLCQIQMGITTCEMSSE